MLSHAFRVRMDEHPLKGDGPQGPGCCGKVSKILGLMGKWDSVRSSHKAHSPPDIRPNRRLEFYR